MHIVIDNREQCPFQFEGDAYPLTRVDFGTLLTGDYSLHGMTDRVGIERKSLADLVTCLGRERDRFERELKRARGLECFVVVCEGSWLELLQGRYNSKLKPLSAVQSVAAFMARFGIPFFFAETRRAAEYLTWSILRQYVQGKYYELKAVGNAVQDQTGHKLSALFS